MIGMADQVILLADASKFGVQAFTRVADLNQIHSIITDNRISSDTLSQLKERSISIRTV